MSDSWFSRRFFSLLNLPTTAIFFHIITKHISSSQSRNQIIKFSSVWWWFFSSCGVFWFSTCDFFRYAFLTVSFFLLHRMKKKRIIFVCLFKSFQYFVRDFLVFLINTWACSLARFSSSNFFFFLFSFSFFASYGFNTPLMIIVQLIHLTSDSVFV